MIFFRKPVLEKSTKFPLGWPAVTQETQTYMELKLKPELKVDMVKERYKLWDCVYSKYWKAPKAP